MTNKQVPDNYNNVDSKSDYKFSKSTNNKNPLILFILVFVTAVGGGEYYLYQKYLELQTDSVINSDISDKVKQLLELNTVDTKMLSMNLTNLGTEVKTNSEQLQVLQNTLKDIDKSNQNPTLYIKLLNIENILNAADSKLRIDKDILTAKELLKSAEQSLINSKQADLITFRKNIIKKIQQLDELNYPDEIQFIANLEELSQRIDQLTALELMVNSKSDEKKVDTINSLVTSVQKNDWQKAVNDFKNDILSLVKIRQFDPDGKNITQLLTDDQLTSLKLLLKLNIEQSIIDLKRKEFSKFNQDLDKFTQNITTYFKNNDGLRNSTMKLLAPMQNTKYPDNLPNMSDLMLDIKNISI